VVLSNQWRDFYARTCNVPTARIVVLGNPVVVPAATIDRRSREVVQFLFLGRIGARKGAFDALRAFAALPDESRKRARLVVAGDGDVAALREESEPVADRVEVHDWLDRAQLDAVLKASDVFVLPSHAEGVPMAMLEAMAFGLPVVTTAVGGIPDVVTDGREGLVVSPGDIDELRQALQTLVDNESLRLDLGRSARLRASQSDVGRYAAQLTHIYRRLVTS